MSVRFVHRSLSPDLPFRDWPVGNPPKARNSDGHQHAEWLPRTDHISLESQIPGCVHAERHAKVGTRIRICFSKRPRRKNITSVYFLTDAEYRRYEARDFRTRTHTLDARWCLMVFHDRKEAYWCVPESRQWHVVIDLPEAYIEAVDVVV